ncbi:LysR family transcriptional regulator [Novosphingobium kaempferiae]|uniref:LysR family transcriptional regulator n=1 Tax=Novosphingobium kaempferiae TaxID=2896849 RepID=UPI001E5E7151|nr:LysR family transcriptional regulator [Novosphingobium kaempferiae]
MSAMESLGIFVRVVEAGSFTGAARIIGTTPSAVSKSMARLEARLGFRLFRRSTRAFTLTAEGERYFERVAPLVRGIEQAGEGIGAGTEASGHLRLSMPADFGRILVNALTVGFHQLHPKVQLDLSLSDRHVDLIREGFDAAIRVGHVPDTGLIARPLGRLPMALVASPDYLARHGTPTCVADLEAHAHVRYMLAGRAFPLMFEAGEFLPPRGVLDADSGEALRIAARNGLGITQILKASVADDLASGHLVEVLPQVPLASVPVQVLHAYARAVPERAAALLRFLGSAMARWTV